MKKEQGQATILAALIIPFLFILFGLVIDYAYVVDEQARLQIALDRGVFAGAARLSHVMNQISEQNWEIHKGFTDLFKNFDRNSQQSMDECEQRVKDLENNQAIAQFENIEDMIANGYAEADQVARSVIGANFPEASYDVLYGKPGERLFETIDRASSGQSDEEGDQIRRDLICGNISGMVFDPEGTDSKTNKDLLSYTYSNKNYVGILARLVGEPKVPLFSTMLGKLRITAVSAAQPYGGSVKRFALLATEDADIETSRGRAIEEAKKFGKPLWFRPAMVPVSAAMAVAGMEQADDETYMH